jgi:hypothetical protein
LPVEGGRFILDLSFLSLEATLTTGTHLEPTGNTFSYRIHYGSDSLVPIDFVELVLARKQ